jgi:outer membrane protein OmpA-like peptidoglycan-associated protein
MTSFKLLRVAGLAAALIVTGCATTDPYTGEQKTSQTTKGAAIGAAAGAVLGVATSSKKDRGKGALIGAAAGAAIGGGIGQYQDRQEAELRQQLEGTGVRVQRDGDNLKLIMPGNITFAVNSEQIQPDFYDVLDSVAVVIRKYDKTLVDVRGYTDSTGSFEHNQALSERRAQSVASYLMSRQVTASRVRTAGYGPRYPIAENNTEAGRAQNRRVEINLQPM